MTAEEVAIFTPIPETVFSVDEVSLPKPLRIHVELEGRPAQCARDLLRLCDLDTALRIIGFVQRLVAFDHVPWAIDADHGRYAALHLEDRSRYLDLEFLPAGQVAWSRTDFSVPGPDDMGVDESGTCDEEGAIQQIVWLMALGRNSAPHLPAQS